MKVEFTVDKYALAYVQLTPEGTDRTGIVHNTRSLDCDGGTINLDFDKDGRVVGIELMDFKYAVES